MKRIWTKFRHWLINKLGGQVPTLIAPKIAYHYETPIQIYASKTISLAFFEGDIVAKEQMVRQELVREIANELLARRLVDIETTTDYNYYLRRYRARVLVIPVEGADNERN
jgi:hypothetical protein